MRFGSRFARSLEAWSLRAAGPAAGALGTLLFLAALPAHGAVVLPNGFVAEPVVTGPFSGETVGFAFLPDGRSLLLELHTGVVRMAAAGSSTADSIATIPGVRGDHPERGLLGVAVDPAWPDRPFFYFIYNHVDGFERVEMWTTAGALWDRTSTAVSLESPYVLLADIRDANGIHNGGSLRFAPDGTLLVSIGDDGGPCLAQDVTSPNGKLLRLDVSQMPGKGYGPPPIAELVPGGNPLAGLGYAPLVYAWGLRNPFRFTVDAPTGRVLIGDVGESAYDEINLIPGHGYRGYNFGWPMYDGIQRISCCDSCNTAAAVRQAVHLVPNPPESLLAVTGGPVMRVKTTSPVSFPASLDGDYFYFEFFSGALHCVRESGGGKWEFAPALPGQPSATTFGLGLPDVTDAQLGAEGALYFVSIGFDASLPRGLYRIRYQKARVDPAPDEHRVPLLQVAPNPARDGDVLRVRVRTPAPGPFRAEIFDTSGARVRRLDLAEARGQAATISWDGRDDLGQPTAAGVYLVRVLSASGQVVGTGKVTRLR